MVVDPDRHIVLGYTRVQIVTDRKLRIPQRAAEPVRYGTPPKELRGGIALFSVKVHVYILTKQRKFYEFCWPAPLECS